jgi:type IV pilus assembly protein PilM
MLSVGLDLSSNEISIVGMSKRRGSFYIANAALSEVAGNSIENGEIKDTVALSKGLQEIWKKYKIPERKVYVGISNQKAIVKEIKLPITDEKDLASSIKYQIGDFMPIPKDNLLYDYYIMEKGDDFSRIMLAGALKSMILNVVESIKNAGLVTQAIDLNCFALHRVINCVYNLKSKKKEEKNVKSYINRVYSPESKKEEKNVKSYCVVNLGREISIVEIIMGEVLKYPRFTSVSAKTFIDAFAKKDKKGKKHYEDVVAKFDFNSVLAAKTKKSKDNFPAEEKNSANKDSEENKTNTIMENTANMMINEIKTSIGHFLEENPKLKIEKIILAGERIANLDRYIEEKIDYKVELLNISDNFSFDYIKRKSFLADKDLESVANKLGLGIGMAIRGLV